MPRLNRIARALAALPALLAPCAHAAGHVLTGARLVVDFADPATGWSSTVSDRVDRIDWTSSNGSVVSNWVANGGPLHCGDPQEWFGQSYGEPENTSPLILFGGSDASWTTVSSTAGRTAALATKCPDYGPPGALSKTRYQVFTNAARRNEMLVTRTFLFNASTPTWNAKGIRAYVPRVPNSHYHQTQFLDTNGSLHVVETALCGSDCEFPNWAGRWFADDDGAGNGLMVIRALSSTAPAFLTVNNDGFSGSTLSSVVLTQPAGGFHSTIVEVEALCFYDATSWPSAARAAGQMPAGCVIPQ